MKKIEVWSHTISLFFFVIVMVVTVPLVYPFIKSNSFSNDYMLQLIDTSELQNPWKLIKGKFKELKSVTEEDERTEILSEVAEIKANLKDPLGILNVKSAYANIRTDPGVRDDNIDGEVANGDYLLYFDTELVDQTNWYLVQQRDDLNLGWISGITVDVVSTNDEAIKDNQELSEFLEDYLHAVMESVANYDFNIVKPFLLSNSLIYNESENYLKYLEEKQIKEELLAYELVDAWNVGEDKIWIRTIECYTITFADGTEKQKNFVSDYLVYITENGYQLIRLLGTYE